MGPARLGCVSFKSFRKLGSQLAGTGKLFKVRTYTYDMNVVNSLLYRRIYIYIILLEEKLQRRLLRSYCSTQTAEALS